MTQGEQIEQAAREFELGAFGDWPRSRAIEFALAQVEKVTAELRTALNKYSEDELLREDKARKADRQAREPQADEDGACTRCGLVWQEEGTTEQHVCPEGFWMPVELEIDRQAREECLEIAKNVWCASQDTYGSGYSAARNKIAQAIRATIKRKDVK